MSNHGFAQNKAETEKSKLVSAEFETYYNADNYEAIFELYDDNFKAELPLEKTQSFFTNLKFQLGNIKERQFKQYVRGSFASYKAVFEGGVFALNISVDEQNQINGLFVEPYKEQKIIPASERNQTSLILPFKEKWFVFWGGDTKKQNYHVESEAQKGAFDFIIHDDNGRSYKTNGMENEDYYAFGKDIIAPCNAQVVMVVDGVPDNTPGEMNPMFVSGNTVVLKTEKEEYLYFAHFKKHSIEVKEGQLVKLGDLLGLSGNSGNSSEPHLHFHIQNQKMMNNSTGIKTFFNEIYVDGSLNKNYSPVKGEAVSNLP
jgi:murein DD-endopeptidase MepM/ murein hydrolase activator NlpD